MCVGRTRKSKAARKQRMLLCVELGLREFRRPERKRIRQRGRG